MNTQNKKRLETKNSKAYVFKHKFDRHRVRMIFADTRSEAFKGLYRTQAKYKVSGSAEDYDFAFCL